MSRIVVLGGGFAGVSTAQELTKRLRGSPLRRGRDAGRRHEILLLNRDNYFVFQPLLADIISGTIETTHVVVPLRRMLPGVTVEVALVTGVDTERQVVHVERRLNGEPYEVSYDALVVALGSVTDFRSVPGMAEHALGIRTLGDAFYLRNRALDMLEEASIETDEAVRKRLLTFVVVGGGSTGVEVAAELHDLVTTAARTFGEPLEPEVVLVHSGQRVLPGFNDRLGRYATRKLREVGVRLVLQRRLTGVHADSVTLDDGSTIPTATVVSTVGNAPHPVVSALPGRKDERGWIRPDERFAVPGLRNVWALGDCASIVDPHTNRPMPATAQHAVREGPHAARNVLAVLDSEEATAFDYHELGMLVSLGRYRGVGQVLRFNVSGFLAWLMWRAYYLMRLPSIERRVRVWMDWTLDLFLERDVVEISVRRTTPRGRAPRSEAFALELAPDRADGSR